MNIEQIKEIIQASIPRDFSNSHGISHKNIDSLLVEPFEVFVNSDEDGVPAESMWIVLRTPDPEGYLVALSSSEISWAVIERDLSGCYQLVVVADSLDEALNGM